MVLPPQSLLLCIADSIALLPKDVSVLWSVRGLKNDVLDLLKSRVGTRELKMLPWINQSEELCDSSTSVFVSHAGFNSIAEWVRFWFIMKRYIFIFARSLLCGVPMLLLPFFGDQHSNARKIESGMVVLRLFYVVLTSPSSWRWLDRSAWCLRLVWNESAGSLGVSLFASVLSTYSSIVDRSSDSETICERCFKMGCSSATRRFVRGHS
jgi:hypothetical protein